MIREKIQFVEHVAAANGDEWFVVPADKFLDICRKLRDDHGFDCLSCLTGTDKGEFFEAVYHVFSYPTKEKAVLKLKLEKNAPVAPSVAGIWPSAAWMEREAFDLLGIGFTGNPDLRRIMMPEDWKGHPLRKDYKEEAEYCGMITTR